METVSVGGHKYSDPDVVSLIRATGGLVDPRSSVLHQARKLNAWFRLFDSSAVGAFERVQILASRCGLVIEAMDVVRDSSKVRDAVLIPRTGSRGNKGKVLYNPLRPPGRIVFSIAHEIAHTFFPNTSSGARFRDIVGADSREANELERLCDLAASEIVMPIEDFQDAARGCFCLESVPKLCQRFGSSYESTVFRLSSAHPSVAVAGLVRYRLTKNDERRRNNVASQLSFSDFGVRAHAQPPKYRRQSVHLSATCGGEHWLPWNKSFDGDSCIYTAGREPGIHLAFETLPNLCDEVGRLEAVRAPFQREEASPEFPDVLFFWSQSPRSS
jgi:hypothetical protein